MADKVNKVKEQVIDTIRLTMAELHSAAEQKTFDVTPPVVDVTTLQAECERLGQELALETQRLNTMVA